jgi:hypothetical protein
MKSLADYPDWVSVNAAVERARAELRAIAEGKAAIETALSKRGEGDEWDAFKEGDTGEPDGIELRAQYQDLERREIFIRKALAKGEKELADVVDRISAEVCASVRPQLVELVSKLLLALKTVSETNDAIWQLQSELEQRGIRTGTIPVLYLPDRAVGRSGWWSHTDLPKSHRRKLSRARGQLNSMYRYAIVKPDQDRASLVRIAAQMIAHDLELSPVPDVVFFQEDRRGLMYNERDLAGYSAGGRRVGIRMGMNAAQTFETLTHELRHVWQQERNWGGYSESFLERDARIYSYSWPIMPQEWSFRQLIESLGNAIVGALEGRVIRWRSDVDDARSRVKVVCCLCPEGGCIHQPK